MRPLKQRKLNVLSRREMILNVSYFNRLLANEMIGRVMITLTEFG